MIARLKLIEARMLAIDPDVFPGAVTEETVREAERQLGVSFPQSYRHFLKEVGAADFPFEIFGLAPEDLSSFSGSYWDVVDVTQTERHDVEPHMQHHLIPLPRMAWEIIGVWILLGFILENVRSFFGTTRTVLTRNQIKHMRHSWIG